MVAKNIKNVKNTEKCTTKHWVLGIIKAIILYGFFYMLLYSIKNDVNLYLVSFILLVLTYFVVMCCHWMRRKNI